MDPQIALMLPVDPSDAEGYAASPEIEVIRTGTFTDMNGRTLEITAEDLDALVRGFEEYTAGQAIPIDIDHRREEAAGWLLGVRRDGSYLYARPEWNELGMLLVGDRRYRYISATINLAKKFLVSISLTNFPAVKYLAPISLTEFAEGGAPEPEAPPPSFLYNAKEEEMSKQQNAQPTDAAEQKQSEGQAAVVPTDAGTGNQNPPVEFSEDALKTMRAQIMAELGEQMKAALGTFRTELTSAAQLSEQARLAVVREVVQGVQEEQKLVVFSQELTTTGARALPFKPSELQQKLAAIPQPHRGTVMDLLRTVYDNGTIDFSESGTSAASTQPGKVSLSPVYASTLTAFLAQGGTIAEFFELNADLLGSKDRYDLADFSEQK